MLIFEGSAIRLCTSVEQLWLPRWLYAENPILERLRPVQRFDSFIDCVRARKATRLCLHRTYAMGDVIMLIPVARALHRLLGLPAPILIPTGSRHLRQLGGPFTDSQVKMVMSRGHVDYGCDVHIELDHAVEIDHRDPVAGAKDRLTLYSEALGCRLPT